MFDFGRKVAENVWSFGKTELTQLLEARIRRVGSAMNESDDDALLKLIEDKFVVNDVFDRLVGSPPHKRSRHARACASVGAGTGSAGGAVSGSVGDVTRAGDAIDPITLEPLNSGTFTRLPCGHAFLDTSLHSLLDGSRVSRSELVAIHCPVDECVRAVPPSVIRRIVGDQAYTRALLQVFAEAEKMVYCPHANCDQCLSAHDTVLNVQCGNGHSMCLGCQASEHHEPATCEEARAAKADQHVLSLAESRLSTALVPPAPANAIEQGPKPESLLQNLMATVRVCPGCRQGIEKSGGCNHMTCRECKMQFCWDCSKPWQGHTVCRRPDDSEQAKQFYRSRFIDFASNPLEAPGQLPRRSSGESSVAASWERIAQAKVLLRDARATAKWAYVHAQHLPSGSSLMLFEDSQGQLEDLIKRLESAVAAEAEAAACGAGNSSSSDESAHYPTLLSVSDALRQFRQKWLQELAKTRA